MMTGSSNNKCPEFYVVQFRDLPVESTDDYVCVPSTWMVISKEIGGRAVIAYPENEDLSTIRGRVKRKEKIKNKWPFFATTVKYTTDSYSDAEHWIVTKKENESLVEKGLKTTVPEKDRTDSSKSNDNSREPLPRTSIKRPALLEPNKQHHSKRVKPDDAAQPSSVVVTDANEEPGFSKSEQLIINQNNQPMEPPQTGTTASDSNDTSSSSQQQDENLQESLPIREQQKLSMPSIDVDTPTFVIDDDKEVQPTSAKEQQVPSYQAISQFTKQLEPTREPQIPVAPSIEMTRKNQLLNSLKTPAKLYSRWNEARRLIPTEKPVERKLRPIYIAKKNKQNKQNPSNLMEQTGSSSTCSVPTQQLYSTQSFQNQCLPTDQINFKQGLLTEPTESSNYNYRPNSQTISTSTPSIGRNSIIHSSPLCQTSKRPQRRQSQPALQDSHQLSQKSKIRIGNSNESKNNRQTSALQRVINETLPPTLTGVINSLRQQGSPTDREYHLNKYLLPENHRKRALVNENHLNVVDDTLQTNEWMVEDTPSAAYCRANSDSDTNTYHEVISDHEMSTDEAAIERTSRLYSTGFTSGSSCADRLIAAQTSTNYQTHSKVSEQQMLNNSDELYSVMRSNSVPKFNKLLDKVAELLSLQNLASSASSSSDLIPEVSEFTEKRYIKISARANSSNVNQYSKNVADNQPKNNNNMWRPFIPPEYDPNDSKWTLKYRTYMIGLVELMPQSGIYVSYGDLKYCEHVSKDCESLARRLLPAVFNRKALSVCLSMTERARASHNVGYNIRPELDDHACSVLLRFVLDHGSQHDWNIDEENILRTLHCTVLDIRFKYGEMVRC